MSVTINTGIEHSKKITTRAIALIVILICIGFVASSLVIRLQAQTGEIVSKANQQVFLWQRIDAAITFTPSDLSPDLVKLKIVLELKKSIGENLQKSLKLQKSLQANLSSSFGILSTFLGFESVSDAHKLTNVSPVFIEAVQTYLEYPDSLLLSGISLWDSDLQFLLKSGAYLTPLRDLAQHVQVAMHDSLSLTISAIALINLLLIISVFFVWRNILVPSFESLEQQQLRQLNTTKRLRIRDEQFTAVFVSLRDAACLMDKFGHIKLSNSLFTDLFLDGEEASKDMTVQNILKSNGDRAFRRSIQSVKSIDDLVNMLNSEHVSQFKDKYITWKFAKVGDDGWFMMAYDQTSLVEQSENRLHSERLEALGRVASGVAHDFNNILGSIMGRTELLCLSKTISLDLEKQIEMIVETCERGRSLTSQLLSYSRKQILRPRLITAITLGDKLKAELTVPCYIELTIECLTDHTVYIDPNYFVTALENITCNAVESMGETEGKININLESSLSVDNIPFLRITVSDTGSGFSSDALNSALEPFYSTKREQHGTGLGLAMVAGFVNQSGGELSLGGDITGARVVIELPISSHGVTPPEQVEILQRMISGQKDTSKSSCFILEDNMSIRKILESYFAPKFKILHTADNCEDAEELLNKTDEINVAICDWNLPGGTSEQVIIKIRESNPEALIIVTTGFVEQYIIDLAEQLDIVVLAKPVSLKTISALLEIGNKMDENQSLLEASQPKWPA